MEEELGLEMLSHCSLLVPLELQSSLYNKTTACLQKLVMYNGCLLFAFGISIRPHSYQ